jgi:transcriptional regulator with XRE-family HTH domain
VYVESGGRGKGNCARASEKSAQLVINQSLGIRIRTLREAAALTQTDLAMALGVTQAAVSAWETGNSLNLKLQTFLRILDVLGVAEPEYLIRGTDW